jgi:hypothetical protein
LNGDKDRDEVYDDNGGSPRAHPRTRLGFGYGYMTSAALCC